MVWVKVGYNYWREVNYKKRPPKPIINLPIRKVGKFGERAASMAPAGIKRAPRPIDFLGKSLAKMVAATRFPKILATVTTLLMRETEFGPSSSKALRIFGVRVEPAIQFTAKNV